MVAKKIQIPDKLIPVFEGDADVRGSYGGRGSAKTRTFAKMSAVRAYALARSGQSGVILCGRQFMNSLDDSSLEEIKGAIRSEQWLEDYFEIGDKYIRTKCGRIKYIFSGLDRNITSIKSKSKILLCWVDEAEEVIDDAWMTLIPTIREEGSELWVTWNPKSKKSATNRRFRETKDPLYKVVEMNWRDNEMFPEKLERERQRDLENNPEQYDHIWEGGFVKALAGAYFAKDLNKTRQESRIGVVAADPLMTIRLFADIGGTGAKADNFVFWVAQFVGKQILAINHYEVRGQPIGAHLDWLRSQGYFPEKAQIWLPHDGSTQDKVYDVSYESAFKAAGYEVEVVTNQGKGAAMARVESVRRTFPNVWFNEATTNSGIEALGWYHEKRDEVRGIGLGPDHDWASHSADAYGLMSIVYEEHNNQSAAIEDPYAAFERRPYQV